MENQGQTKKQRAPQDWGRLCSMIAAIFVIFMAVYIPTGPYKKFRAAREEVLDLRGKLEEVQQAKQMELNRLEGQKALMSALNERAPNFDMWTFLDGALTEMKLKERAGIDKYKPPRTDKRAPADSTMLQLKLSGIALQELIDFLHRVYTSKDLVVVYRVESLKPTSDSKGLDCTVVFMSPAKAPAA